MGRVDVQVNKASLPHTAISNPEEGWVSLPHLIEHLVWGFIALDGEIIEDAGKASVMIAVGTYLGREDC
ncbi:hypothetical protein HA51_04310 [Pantoea rwandensis]|uniref:Uncharacterized protein n=1 Tax=Pantoea rwandensis TaxID=1076550 RepID=A0A1X1D367_9GAMM|nr:hypothetical protein HA51_04310 [Pantoea rwandensis]